MTPEKFKQLTRKLEIRGIYLMGHEANIRDDFVPSETDSIEGVQQSFSGITGYFIGESQIVFRFRAGVRVMSPDAPDEALEGEGEEHRLVEIKADFNAVYDLKEELSEEEIETFSEYSALYNVWPYWREFVQNTCYRMNMPPLKIPFLCRGTETVSED